MVFILSRTHAIDGNLIIFQVGWAKQRVPITKSRWARAFALCPAYSTHPEIGVEAPLWGASTPVLGQVYSTTSDLILVPERIGISWF